MTNTYKDTAPYKLKLVEEIRCIRCVNERILRALDEGQFPPYQMYKFSGSAESHATDKKYNTGNIIDDLHDMRYELETLLKKLNNNLYVDYLFEKTSTDKAHEDKK